MVPLIDFDERWFDRKLSFARWYGGLYDSAGTAPTSKEKKHFPGCYGMVYTVEMNKIIILKYCLILKKLGFEWLKIHLSYGMVELPSGKMKS
jgi:hypothetical protein